jgi:adenosylcobyric acid synthase
LDDEVNVDFIQSSIEAYDAIILPGTKKTIQDLRWLKKSSLFDKLKRFKKPIFGICGGYQMMFEKIIDKIGIENSANSVEIGFGFVKGDVRFKKDKILKNKEYYQFGYKLKGFEIRHGEVDKEFAFLDTAQIKGTFVHSIFENDNFRNCYLKSINPNYNGYNFFEHKKKQINTFIKEMEKYIKLDKIIKKL